MCDKENCECPCNCGGFECGEFVKQPCPECDTESGCGQCKNVVPQDKNESKDQEIVTFCVNRGRKVLTNYYGRDYAGLEDPDTVLTDCLADLMHAARAIGVDWGLCIDRATMHYNAEICPDDIEKAWRTGL